MRGVLVIWWKAKARVGESIIMTRGVLGRPRLKVGESVIMTRGVLVT